MSQLADLRGTPLIELDADLIAEALKRILGQPAVPVAAFNSAI